MTKTVNVSKIIEYMKTITDITNILWQNIFFDVPKTINWINTDIYLAINIVSEVPMFSKKQARLEFRFLATKDNITKQSLIEAEKVITQNLSFETNNWVRDFNWFKVSSFTEANATILRDELNRNLMIKDYFLTFFKYEY